MTAIIDAKTPKGAAGATLRAIRKLPGGEYASIRRTEHGNGWQVVWEEGPYEWTIAATMGSDIWAEELGFKSQVATFDFQQEVGNWMAEPQNSFVLNFYPEV